ncbi:GIY-YIG nuclease family protein [Micromonospora sp. 15K316]|uniref:GIY-YIG nuclease family protein n=1 Tax=Micromonospora sp. 15K316 TaxID=2530376 RepID=UPI00104738CA|nr:GIY-YIG nuclease family protein [Micromonospora sp. 15K316]TDC38344.1 GIY-YIG nuclease family protein [Micromonospora sp. 15K316]
MLPRQIDLGTNVLPREVQAIREAIAQALKVPDPQRPSQTIGQAKAGIYAFYDYDREPIYVGQTAEGFGVRLGRHLTGQRSDAVAKYVLDPFEVHTISMWSLPHIGDMPARQRKAALDPYEYTVYRQLLSASAFGAILNEGDIPEGALQELPEPVTRVIIPDEIFPDRSHPDVRIARRAQTISLLARNISERKVSKGLRRTLVTQTERLNALAKRRFEALGGPIENEGAEGVVEEPDDLFSGS